MTALPKMFSTEASNNREVRVLPVRSHTLQLCLVVLSVSLLAPVTAAEPKFRRPIALALDATNDLLYTANRDGHSVSVIDLEQNKVTAEIDVGGKPSDIELISEDQLIVLDEANHEACLLTQDDSKWKVTARTPVSPYPVRILLDRGKKRMFVTSLWSRTVSLLEIPDNRRDGPKLIESIRLSFEPREMCLTADGQHVIVASAFEAHLAVVEADSLERVCETPILGHNIGGIAVSADGKQLLLSQQELNPLAHSTRDDIHWGNLISNQLVSYKINDICRKEPETSHRVATDIGEPGAGAGDPGPLLIGKFGQVIVLLSGVHEIASGSVESLELSRTVVGRRPIALTTAPDGTTYVANMFSDSVTVQSVTGLIVKELSLGTQPDPDPLRQGEVAFFDAKLSHDGWMS